MEILHTLVIELVVLVVLAAFLELLIPAGDLSRYVRMVFGLLIIVAVLHAATGFWQRGRAMDLGALALLPPAATSSGEDALEEGRRQWAQTQATTLESYRQGLARQIMALVGLNPDVEITEVIVELEQEGVSEPMGSIRRVTLVGAPAADTHGEPPNMEQLCRTIAEFYSLDPERVGYQW